MVESTRAAKSGVEGVRAVGSANYDNVAVVQNRGRLLRVQQILVGNRLLSIDVQCRVALKTSRIAKAKKTVRGNVHYFPFNRAFITRQ